MLKFGKKKPLYVLSASEKAKVKSVSDRLDVAAEEVVAARAILGATLEGIIKTRLSEVRNEELVFNFDDLAFYREPVKATNEAPADNAQAHGRLG